MLIYGIAEPFDNSNSGAALSGMGATIDSEKFI
jgi:hypothetical protein